jgi:signal transduction histidine kinase
MNFSNRQYEALQTLAVLTAESSDVEGVYSRLADIVDDIVPHEGMIFTLLERDRFIIRIGTGDLPPSREFGESYSLTGTLMEYVVSKRKWHSVVFTERSQLDGVYSGLLPAFDVGYRSWLVVPVFSGAEIIGTLHIRRKEPKSFNELDAIFMEQVVIHLSAATKKYQMLESRRVELVRSDVALELSGVLSQATTLEGSVATIGALISKTMPVDRFAISLYDSDRELSRDVGIWGEPIPGWDSIEEKPLGIHDSSHFTLEDRARIVPTAVIESAELESQPGLALGAAVGLVSMMSASLFVQGVFRGTVGVRSRKKEAYDGQSLRFIQEISAQLNQFISASESRRNEIAALTESESLKTDQAISAVQTEFQQIKDRVIDSISHELRTPLTVITARADLLSRHLNSDDSRVLEGIASIKRSTSELKRLIDRLIDHADRVTGDQAPDYQNSTFRTLEDELRVSMFGIPKLNPARIKISFDDPDTGIYCDKAQITAALFELVDNSLKYGPQDSVITVRMTEFGGEISLSVTDEGMSVESSQASGLFDAFERGNSWGDSLQRGVGLGLPYVSMIAQSHSGDAWFRKSDSGSSEFGITLPFAG